MQIFRGQFKVNTIFGKNKLFLWTIVWVSLPSTLVAQKITDYLEYRKISGVGYSWKTVNLANSYSHPVVVCALDLPSSGHHEAVVRIRNASSSSFEIKIQRPEDSDPGYTTTAECLISEEGSYRIPFKYEAHTVKSDGTNHGKSTTLHGTIPADWNANTAEDVTNDIQNSYSRPTVLGQVMSYEDNRFSAFWSFNCNDRKQPAFADTGKICVGKHIGQDVPDLPLGSFRKTETLGYIVAESGTYRLKDFTIRIARGARTVQGVGNTPPYTYTLDEHYDDAVVTQEAMRGNNGSWAVLYSSNPVSNSLRLAVDEETVKGDTTRKHTSERVAYWVFRYDPVSLADIRINEVQYRQTANGSDNDEFVEFYVRSGGNLRGYLFTDQDGSSHLYRFDSHTVSTGDYVVLHIGSGTDGVVGNVHHFYMNRSPIFNNDGDDIDLYRPVNDDVTVIDGSPRIVIPHDYVSYDSGSAIDAPSTSLGGVTVSWDDSENSRIAGASPGTSIALTPNGEDSDSSKCWELSATTDPSKKATHCSNYIPTRDSNTTSGQINSIGINNNASPNLSITKTSIVLSDPVNGTSNPKRIPGATIRYCFTIDNTGDGTAYDLNLSDPLSGSGREHLDYHRSGSVIQSISSPCDCAAITNTGGSIDADRNVTISIGDLSGSDDTAHSRACAYIETTIQ